MIFSDKNSILSIGLPESRARNTSEGIPKNEVFLFILK